MITAVLVLQAPLRDLSLSPTPISDNFISGEPLTPPRVRYCNGASASACENRKSVGVVSGAGHVIELANGADHGARVLLLHRLPSRGHQRLD